jgi:hypothetical protein
MDSQVKGRSLARPGISKQGPFHERGNKVLLPFVATSLKPDIKRPTVDFAPCDDQRPWPEISLSNVHVFVVDDEIDSRDMVENLLKGLEHWFRRQALRRKLLIAFWRVGPMCLFVTLG